MPSIITGYIFGLLFKKKVPAIWSIFTATIAQTAISIAFIPLIELLTEHNLIDDIKTIFSISESSNFDSYLLLIFYAVALIQTFLSFLVVNSEIKKMQGYNGDEKNDFFAAIS